MKRAARARDSLLASYVGNLGEVISRRRTESALAAAKVEAELANRAKSEFLANMSHELRTPLNAILGFAEVLQKGIAGETLSERQKGYATDIHTAGQHLLGIINEVLDIAKIESGRFEIEPEIQEVGELISHCVGLIAGKVAGKNQHLRVRVEQDLPAVLIDPRRFKQILLNLLSNAHKFTREGGRIDIGARRNSSGGVELIVRDNGIGMSSQEMRQALQPFGQVQSAYARNHGGTGLGLPITKGLVELHGGALNMTSQPNVGTLIRISLPAERVVAHGAGAPAPDRAGAAS